MATTLIEWREWEDPAQRKENSGAGTAPLEVSEQHPLPHSLFIQDGEDSNYEEVSNNNPLPVKIKPHQIMGRALPQVVVSTSVPTLIFPANPFRTSILVTNATGTQITYVQSDRAVSATNGQYLGATAGTSITFNSQGELWGLSLVAAQTLTLWEEFETY